MRLAFSPTTGTPYPFIASAFSPRTYARSKGVRGLGLGDTTSTNTDQQEPSLTQQYTTSVIQGATTGAGIATALGGSTKADIVGAVAAGLIASAPIPVVGPFLAAIGAIMGPIAVMFKGCGQTCIQATDYANQAATALGQIKTMYFNQPVHYYSQQQAALQAVTNVVNWIKQACGNPALGAAGQRCLSERVIRGAPAPWCPTADHTGCDIWSTFYDPIANDTSVVPDPAEATVAGTSGGVGGFISSFPIPLLLIGGGVLAFSMMGGD